MAVDKHEHCACYQTTANQLFETAIALDTEEGRTLKLKSRLQSAVEALIWCLARIDDPPAWVRCTIDEVEAPL